MLEYQGMTRALVGYCKEEFPPHVGALVAAPTGPGHGAMRSRHARMHEKSIAN
jgi:hypothetical protein